MNRDDREWLGTKVYPRLERDDDTGCWNWTGALGKDGYGRVLRRPKHYLVHRVIFEDYEGPIPDGMQTDHICLNRRCANPKHLRLVTVKQNNEHLSPGRKNNTSGYRGVSADSGKWRVHVQHNGKQYNGGLFDDIEEANRAAIALRNRLHTHNDEDGAA